MKQPVVSCNPDVTGGTPVFHRTGDPVQILLDYLEAGESIDDVFVTVDRNLSFQRNLASLPIAVVILKHGQAGFRI